MSQSTLSSPVDLFRHAWNRFSSRWSLAVIISLATSLLYLAISVLFAGAIVGFGASLTLGTAIAGIIGWIVLMILIAIYFTSMMLVLMSEEKTITLGQTMMRANKVYWPLFITAIVSALTIGGASLFFLIPGIILAVYFSQSQLVAVNEGLKGQAALRRSRAITDGRWGAILWRILFISIIVSLIDMIATGLIKLVGVSASDANNIASSIAALVTGPLTVAYLVEMYNDLKSAKGEKGNSGLYTALTVVGLLIVAGLISTVALLPEQMGGTFKSEWIKALDESGRLNINSSSSYDWHWGGSVSEDNQ